MVPSVEAVAKERADAKALADEIATMAARIDAATHRLLTCIRKFDETGEWYRQGAISCAMWLTWRIHLDPVTAREKVRVARALGNLPHIDGALQRGEISYSKVRAMTRVATPENEQHLLELARYSTGTQLDRICRATGRVISEFKPGYRLNDQRGVRLQGMPSGLVRLIVDLHPDEAQLVMEAIEKARQLATPDAPAQDRHASAESRAVASEQSGQEPAPSRDAFTGAAFGEDDDDDGDASAESSASPPSTNPYVNKTEGRDYLSRADALLRVAESFLATDAGCRRAGERYQVFIHLDQELCGEKGQLAATLDDGTRLSADSFQRLSCDCALVPVKHGADGEILSVGRRTRRIPPALFRALWIRDEGRCRFPGCRNHIFLDGHHIRHWAQGGETKLSNTALLCGHHHRMVHDGGMRMEMKPDGELVFTDRSGWKAGASPPPVSFPPDCDVIEDLVNDLSRHGIVVDNSTNIPLWDGDPMDLSSCVDAALGKLSLM